jgi:proteasome lid subunit RPN8/RPN11
LSSVFIRKEAALQALKTVCRGLATSPSDNNVEISGLLLGKEFSGGVVITSTTTGKQTSSQSGSELDENFMAAIAQDMITGRMAERIVGMFHSHPGIGIFLSQQDVRTLANFHALYPGFLMMVIDPLKLKKRYEFFRYDSETRMAHLLAVEEL